MVSSLGAYGRDSDDKVSCLANHSKRGTHACFRLVKSSSSMTLVQSITVIVDELPGPYCIQYGRCSCKSCNHTASELISWLTVSVPGSSLHKLEQRFVDIDNTIVGRPRLAAASAHAYGPCRQRGKMALRSVNRYFRLQYSIYPHQHRLYLQYFFSCITTSS